MAPPVTRSKSATPSRARGNLASGRGRQPPGGNGGNGGNANGEPNANGPPAPGGNGGAAGGGELVPRDDAAALRAVVARQEQERQEQERQEQRRRELELLTLQIEMHGELTQEVRTLGVALGDRTARIAALEEQRDADRARIAALEQRDADRSCIEQRDARISALEEEVAQLRLVVEDILEEEEEAAEAVQE